MSKPLSKTKIVGHIAEKVGTPKKTAAMFFDELFKLAVKEAKGAAGKFVIPGLGRLVKASVQSVERRCPEVIVDFSEFWPPVGLSLQVNGGFSLLRLPHRVVCCWFLAAGAGTIAPQPHRRCCKSLFQFA